MNVLITNVHSIRNAGDAVLLDISRQLIRQAYPTADITIIINDPASAPETKNIENMIAIGSLASRLKRVDGSWNPAGLLNIPAHRAWLKAYQTADVVVSVAGNFLYSSGKLGIPFTLAIAELAVATHCKKPTIMFPQTLGPIWRKRDQRLLAWLSKRLTTMFVRDEASRALVGEIGGRTDHITVVPDIAFAYPPVPEDDGRALLQKHAVESNVPLLGITAINWGGLNAQFDGQVAYERGIVDAITHFVQTYSGHVVLFSQVQGPSIVEDDRLTAKRIYEQVESLHEHVTFIGEGVPADTLKSAYGLMDVFIGTRLHSNIFALTEHTPVVAIAYQPKTRGVLKLLDLEAWVIDIEEVSAATLIPKLDALWQQKADVKTHIRSQLTTIHAQLHTIVEQLRMVNERSPSTR